MRPEKVLEAFETYLLTYHKELPIEQRTAILEALRGILAAESSTWWDDSSCSIGYD
jgi:hypothetical protein